jgi:MFS family permease
MGKIPSKITPWINVVVAALIMVATLPGRTQGLGLITEPLLRDLHVDRVSYAQINLWATLLGAVVCLPAGRIFDRLGLRVTTTLITALLSLVVWRMGALAGGIAALFALVFATRALGQSALSVASITAVGKAFDRAVGFAMGVYSVLLTILFAGAFTYFGGVVRNSGWREAWFKIALALILFVAPAVLLFLREPGAATTSKDEGAGGEGLSLRDALGTPAFWVFGGATSLYGLVASGLGLFNEAVLAERGFGQETYHRFLAGTAVIALVGQFACGLLTLRWSMQKLTAVALFVYGLALASFPFLTTLPQLWIFASLMGLSGGMITVIFFAIWRRAYGARRLGRIQGAAQMLTVLASAVGPLLFAKSVELTGSYMPVMRTLAIAVALLGAAALRVRLPLKQEPVESGFQQA